MAFAVDPRVAPFTVQEFSDLVSSAFNLQLADSESPLHAPVLSLTPPSPHALSLPDADEDRPASTSDCFDEGTDDGYQRLRSPSRVDGYPQSQLSPHERRSRSRTITALRVFHQVRTRASAFVLRPRAPSRTSSPSPVPFEPIPPLSISPTFIPSTIVSPRSPSPLSMLDLNLDRPVSRPRSRAESLPRPSFFKRDTTPPPLPGRQTRPNTSSGACTASPGLPSFFDDSPSKSKRAYSRPSTSASTVHPLSRVATSSSAHAVLSTDGLPSFFEDSGYQITKPVAPHYCRSDTPPGTVPQRVHTRLPPLRKAKSGGYGLFGRGNRKGHSKSPVENAPAGLGYEEPALWAAQQDPHTPSPFTYPREPPPVPESSPMLNNSLDEMSPPMPPSDMQCSETHCVPFQASTRSSSSLSSKISSIVSIAFPSKTRAHARSKLNLTIATGPDPASVHSSPSTMSSLSSPTTPVSPTAMFLRSQPYVFPGNTDMHHLDKSFSEAEEDALAIGRVLTPEADPFAKAEIVVPVEGTPRPPTPPSASRRASSQQSPPLALTRTQTWDEDRAKVAAPTKRTRNSMPASPVSTAYTFPSTCSIYTGRDFGPAAKLPPTPRKDMPPSAWSPFSTPAASTLPGSPSTPPSSPARSPSGAKLQPRQSPRSPPSPNTSASAFPLPPRTIPARMALPPRPPPNRALPAPPLPSPPPPPVPPKDMSLSRVSRAHKSLPPSPRSMESPSGSPSSVRSYGETALKSNRFEFSDRQLTMLPLGTGIRDIFPDEGYPEDDDLPLIENCDFNSSSLGEPWSGSSPGSNWQAPPASSPWRIRPVTSKRRSVDSVSTVTASPTSSALYEATRDWDSETSAAALSKLPALQIDTRSLDITPSATPSGSGRNSECCGSATSPSTFYTAIESPNAIDSPLRERPGSLGARMASSLPDSPFMGRTGGRL
ncbi:hypothetical protein ONZ51_g3334 [Trametes cubensis]|uniref:Uncharacterized protein n=1 Tax=Trametes cubensis TaxID=1111947 RepID=A0AAD7TYF8_9APHY|nr:hypothetical protein ONZ51_g3334 [Trametes cubensis]